MPSTAKDRGTQNDISMQKKYRVYANHETDDERSWQSQHPLTLVSVQAGGFGCMNMLSIALFLFCRCPLASTGKSDI